MNNVLDLIQNIGELERENQRLREGLLQIYNLKDVVDDEIVKHTSDYAKRVLNGEKVDTKK